MSAKSEARQQLSWSFAARRGRRGDRERRCWCELGVFCHLDGCSGSGIGAGCRFGRFTWAGAGRFGGILGTQNGAGEGLLMRSGDPKAVFWSFSLADEGTNGLIVRIVIALDPLIVSIKHLVAPGAPKTGRVHSQQKLMATDGTKSTQTIPSTHFLRTPKPPLDSLRNSTSHTALWLTQTQS